MSQFRKKSEIIDDKADEEVLPGIKNKILSDAVYDRIIEEAERTDTHVHSTFSDGNTRIGRILEEATELGLRETGVSDHVNGIDEDKNYSPKTNVVLDEDLNKIISTETVVRHTEDISEESVQSKSIDRKYSDSRSKVIDQNIPVNIGKNFWDEIPHSSQEVVKLILSLRHFAVDEWLQETQSSTDNIDFTGYRENRDIDFSAGIELDWNPPIGIEEGLKESEKRIVAENYAENLEGFLEYLEEPEKNIPQQVDIGHVIGSVHDVNIDYKPRYVKKDEKFQDLDQEELTDVVDIYFDKMELMIEQDQIFDKLAHPSLIERNEVIMNAVTQKGHKTLGEQVKREKYSEAKEEYQRFDGWDDKGIDDFKDLYEVKLQRKIMKDYYEPVVEKLKHSDIIPEMNGKGLERQEHPSEFWYLLLEEDLTYEIGSDSHRKNELYRRLISPRDSSGISYQKRIS